jgi:DNA topoisomerase-1
MTGCKICGRNIESEDLCRYHVEALQNLHAAYEGWKSASGVDWIEYLEGLEKTEVTGRWILDVVEYVRQRDGL